MKFDKVKDLLIVVLLVGMVLAIKYMDESTNIIEGNHTTIEDTILEEEAWFWGIHI